MTSSIELAVYEELAELLRERTPSPLTHLEPHQTPPSEPWEGWLIQAGRGSGKTAAIAAYVTDHINGPPCITGTMPHKMALIAPTIGDAVESAARHPICLKSLSPTGRLQQRAGGTIFTWPNHSEIKLFGVHTQEDVERLRAGGNNCLVWCEELAVWRHLEDGWDQMQLGLRIGPNPHWVGSSTPKRRRKFVEIVNDPQVRITTAHTDDNPHLEQSVRDRLKRMYGGTSKGRQELAGELLMEVEGALWTDDTIEKYRQPVAGTMARIVVGVDPQGGGEGSGTTGIIAAGITKGKCICGQNQDRLPHAFVLADESISASPAGWARHVLLLLAQVEGDRIVVERNFGGPMVESTIRNVDKNAPVEMVVASRGKTQRAEPIGALYEQGRVHHVGVLPELEDELVTWTADEAWSPNRLDSLVWAITALGLSEWSEARVSSAANRVVI